MSVCNKRVPDEINEWPDDETSDIELPGLSSASRGIRLLLRLGS